MISFKPLCPMKNQDFHNKRNNWNPGLRELFEAPNFLTQRSIYQSVRHFSDKINGIILDVGCGTKPYQELFLAKEYIGLEIRSERESLADVYYDGKIFPFADDTFDSVVAFQSIYQFDDIDNAFKEISRVLKPDGNMLILVPFIWFDGNVTTEYRLSFQNTIKLLEKNGLVLEEQSLLCNNLSAIITLFNSYTNSELLDKIKIRILRKTLKLLVTFFCNLLGLLSIKILPKSSSLYLNRIFVAKNVNNKINKLDSV